MVHKVLGWAQAGSDHAEADAARWVHSLPETVETVEHFPKEGTVL